MFKIDTLPGFVREFPLQHYKHVIHFYIFNSSGMHSSFKMYR